MNDERIVIEISVKNNIVSINKIINCFNWFDAKEVKFGIGTNGKYKKYDTKYLNLVANELIQDKVNIEFLAGKESFRCLRNYSSQDVVLLSCTIDYLRYQSKKKKIARDIEKIMETIGIVTCVYSLEDSFWQNNTDISNYELKGKEMKNIPTRESEIFEGELEVDVDKLPGHDKLIDGLWYGAAWQMWFSSLYFKYVDQKAINEFKNCYVNETVSNNCIHIQLYEDIKDYDKKENRERQWEFKRSIAFDEVVEAANERFYKQESDPTTEILTGTFKHGGTRKIVTYLSENDNITSKKVATKFEELEYNSTGKLLYRGIIEI